MGIRIITVFVTIVLPSSAHADALRATLGQPVTEISHSVQMTLRDGVAVFRVQRVFANSGGRADEAVLDIGLPPGAAATGLRIRARDRWYDGDLMEAEKARRLYEELTGRGAWDPKDPALLQWRWVDQLLLQVFPIMPKGTSFVEYTLTVPTQYENGRYVVSYPRANGLAVPVMIVDPGHGDATTPVHLDRRRVAPDAPIVLGKRDPARHEPPSPIVVEPGASYVESHIVVGQSGTIKKATAFLDIEHTYREDLLVELITPSGELLVLHDRSGGDKNDVRDDFELELPPNTGASGTWTLVVSDHAGLDVGALQSWSLRLEVKGRKRPIMARANELPLFIPDAATNDDLPEHLATIEVAPPPIDTVTARLGVARASSERAFVRLALDAAPQLRPLPKKASVVLVVDGSHSIGPDGIAAQLKTAEAYMSHIPDAAVEIVVFRRLGKRLFDQFVPATELSKALQVAKSLGRLEPGNGSALEEGALVAAEALRSRRGDKRVVLLTDALLRSSYTESLGLHALTSLSSDTVVHVAVMESGGDEEASERRDDDHELSRLALRHNGVLWHLEAIGDPVVRNLKQVMLGLVRPVRIDHFVIEGVDLGDLTADVPSTLWEGEGFRAMVRENRKPTHMRLRGKIWAHQFERRVRINESFSRATAAFVFSEDEHHDLSTAEMMKLATYAGVVSPVTSYLAIEPGVRPSTAGIDRSMSGTGLGGGGMAYGAGVGRLGGRFPPPEPDLEPLLTDAVTACVEKDQPEPGWEVHLQVETIYDEVVDVIVSKDPAPPFLECIVEATWSVRLDESFHRQRQMHELILSDESSL